MGFLIDMYRTGSCASSYKREYLVSGSLVKFEDPLGWQGRIKSRNERRVLCCGSLILHIPHSESCMYAVFCELSCAKEIFFFWARSVYSSYRQLGPGIMILCFSCHFGFPFLRLFRCFSSFVSCSHISCVHIQSCPKTCDTAIQYVSVRFADTIQWHDRRKPLPTD
jgi:hypothetical protein